jgi:Zn-dependent M28 family amino/carboxypeptidase
MRYGVRLPRGLIVAVAGRRLLAVLLLLSANAMTVADTPSKETSAWWGHIRILASDEFQGRLTGSPGYQQAATYVADSFSKFGLTPAGDDDYFQSVGYVVQRVVPDRTSISLVRAKGNERLSVGDDLVLSSNTEQRTSVAGPLVFAGYGIHLPEVGYDDYHDLPVKGAIVVVLVGGPEALNGAQRAHAYAESLPHYLEAQGAVGVISIYNPKDREVPWSRIKAASVQPGMLLEERALRRYQHPVFSATFNDAVADKLFQNSGHSFSELTALADAHKPLPRFPLNLDLQAKVATELSHTRADNVVAKLPGSDASISRETIVLSAHLDHLGTGTPDHGDGIFHGAMDNASGVASLLEVARAMQKLGHRPRRSVLFVAVSGEEKGLLGSRYFAAHPTTQAGSMVADINMDMFLPLYPLKRVVVFGADESSLGEDARAVCGQLGIDLAPDPTPDHLIFVRSDQYSFIRKGVPSLMPTMSPRPGTAETEVHESWFSNRYHAQADDLNQPVDLGGADAFNTFLVTLITRVAEAPSRPAWHKSSFFARFGESPLP